MASASGEPLGWGYFNPGSSLAGRMVSFGTIPFQEAILEHLNQALCLRKALLDPVETTVYRLVNGEGDLLPGLVVDCYGPVVVVQMATAGVVALRSLIVDWIVATLKPICIYEKSTGPARREEGLEDAEGVLYGSLPEELVVKENGLLFTVPVVSGQKTGLFLDHRAMRQRVRELARGKRVLNCFGYTGGFSVYAAAGGASCVDTVDISAEAIAGARRNMELNGFSTDPEQYITEDVFTFLRRSSLEYDLVILDPPAFAKRKKDVIPGCRGYKDINRIALQKMPPGSLLLTSSCSYYVDPILFQKVVFQAALEAKRVVKIIGRHELAVDHPINLCHPEGEYLKSLLLFVE